MTIINLYLYDENFDPVEGRDATLVYFDEGANTWSADPQITDVDGLVSVNDNGSTNRFLVIAGAPGENDIVKKIANVEKIYG